MLETFPDTFAVLPAFDEEIRIVFDERISESGAQGPLDQAVTVSPESGEVTVRHSSRALRVRMEGGFLPDEVYRVTVQPVVRDLFGNSLVEPFEFVFSTGAEMTPTVLAGSIVDRITDEPVEGARVTARAERPPGVEASDDQVVPTHIALTDERGVYALRYVPSGGYEITAFVDQDRSGGPTGFEPIATGRNVLNPGDTVLLNLALLAPDTTPAIVQSVDVVDSLTLSVQFDDYLDSASSLAAVSASLGPDSLGPAEVVTIMHERDYLERRDAIRDSSYVADSIRFEDEQQQIESLLSAGDTVAASEIEADSRIPVRPGPPSAALLRARDLPKQVLYLLLADTLATDRPFELAVQGVTNINGVPDGGGTAEVLREAPQGE